MINDLDMQGWAYLLAPTFQFVNTAGKPLTEGYLEVYIAGTRNKYYCASDFDGTLHPFQIPLDSLGSNIVLADPSQAYDVYVYNRFGSLVMSRYNVSPSNAGGSGVLTITISSNDDTVQVVKDGNNYDLSIADTVARIDDIEDRLDEIGDGSVGYAVAHSELASDGLFELTNDKNKDLDYTGDMHGFRLKPGHVYQLNFNAKFDCNNDTNDLISGKFYLDGDNVVSQEWQFNVDNSFEHQESFNGSTVLVIPEDVSYYDVKLKYLFDDEALDLYLNKISIVDVTILTQGASGVVYTQGDGIIINEDNSISVDMDYINEHLEIDASSILSSAYNYTDDRVSQASGDLINIISEATANIPPQVQSDWNQDDDTQVDYIKNKPDLDIYATHDELETTVTNVVSSVSSVLQNEIENIDLSSYATHDEVNTAITNASGDIINYVDNSIDNVTNVIESVSGDLQEQINNIPEQVQSNWTEDDTTDPSYILNKPNELELVAGENIAIFVSGGTITISASSPDLSDYATHNEVYNSSVSAINSANSYTDTAIANLDLTPAVEIVSPNNTISVSSVVNSANNTKTFYIDTNDPDTNYWIGEANLSLSDQSSQGQVGYYKDVFDYTTRLNGNLDATKLKKGLYLLTANVMVVADEVNNDLAEIQIQSNSTSAISYTSSVFQHDCSVADTLGEPMDESHQIATIVRVVYDDTPMSLIARMDDPTTVSNELHLWFSDICLYELQGTTVGGGTTPSASGSYDAGWGIVINGNVISVNQSIIPDISNLASETYVNNRIASAVNIVESEIPDVSNLATRNELNTASGNIINYVNDQIDDIPAQVQSDWAVTNIQDLAYIKNKPSESQLIPGANISITASGSDYVISSTGGGGEQVNANWNETDPSDPSYIENKPDLSIYATITQVGEVSGDIISQIPDVSNLATKDEVNTASATLNNKIDTVSGAIPTLPEEEEVEFEEIDLSNYALASAIPDVSNFATKGELSVVEGEIPDVSNLATKAEVATATGDLQSQINNLPSQVQSNWTESDDSDPSYIQNKPDLTSFATKTEVQAVSAAIPDTSDMATQTWVDNQGYLTSIPSNYATDDEVNTAISNATSSLATKVEVNNASATLNTKIDEVSGSIPTLPDEEEVEFEELDLSNYATETYVDNAIAEIDIPEVSGASGISVNDNVISLDNPVGLVAGDNITITVSGDSAIISGQAGGSTYSAGTGIDITNNTISVDDTIALKSEIPDDVRKINFTTSTRLIRQQIDSYINNNKFVYLTVLPNNKPSSTNPILSNIFETGGGNLVLSNLTSDYVTFTGICRASLTNKDYTVDFTYNFYSNSWSYSCDKVITYTNDISNLATKAEVQAVSAAIPDTTGMVTYSGNTAINHIQLVSTLPASPDANTIYLIPEV